LTACDTGDVNAAKILIQHGANVNAKGLGNTTPAHLAAYGGYCKMIILLHKNGANMGAEDDKGETPLMTAERTGRKDIVLYLRKNGIVK